MNFESAGIVFDLSFHPSRNIIATGTIEGLISIFEIEDNPEDISQGNKLSNTSNTSYTAKSSKISKIFTSIHHEDSIRSLDFTLDGQGLVSVSKDKSMQMLNLEHEQVILKKPNAHKEPINKVRCLTENLIATGDDSGQVKVWDLRTRKIARKYHEHLDFISDIKYTSDHTMIVSSGDGCLSIYDARKNKAVAVSANQDDELLAIQVVVVGTQSGTLLLFSFNQWGDCTDRFPGHPSSVSSLVKSSDTTLFTGSGDGIIRSVGILPNVLLGTINNQNGTNGSSRSDEMPIEAMSLSSDGRWLATSSHDETVNLWDTLAINGKNLSDGEVKRDGKDRNKDFEDGDESDNDDLFLEEKVKKNKSRKTKKSFVSDSNSSFFSGLD